MTTVELLEWGYYTIKDQLQFGLPEEQAIRARERRVSGVLKDAIKQVKAMEEEIAELKRKLNEATRAN